MKILSCRWLFLILIFLIIGCAERQTINEADYADLTEAQLTRYKKAANEGDISACTILASYYVNTKNDRKAALPLLYKAAKTGYPLAEHNLGVLLHSSSDVENVEESKYWLEKARLDGFAY